MGDSGFIKSQPSGPRAGALRPTEAAATVSVSATCATCQFIGVGYWGEEPWREHHCGKSDERRRDQFRSSGDRAEDFMSEFRKFYDARADQRACRYYEERERLDAERMGLLRSLIAADRYTYARLGFFSRENHLCERMAGKFVEQGRNHDPTSGERLWRLTSVGRAEVGRNPAVKETPAQPQLALSESEARSTGNTPESTITCAAPGASPKPPGAS